jgi:thiol-disulfide isomerase/thioredoxin
MRRLVVTLVSITAMLAGFYLSARHFSQPLPTPVAQQTPGGSLIGSLRPDFQLGSNKGEMVSPADFAGKTVLINFWATWCAPCRQEMPMLMDLQRKHGAEGLQVVGIALDDVRQVRDFVETYGISYPILMGETDVFETSAAYGNTEGVLPFSLLVDNLGIVRWQYAGKIKQEQITDILSDLL